MKARPKYPIEVLTTGILVLVFFSLPLFWARWLCKSLLGDLTPLSWRTVSIEPCRLVPDEIENHPDVRRHSHVHAHIIHPEAPQTLSFFDYFSDKALDGRHHRVIHFDLGGEDAVWTYFDADSGQFVSRWIDAQRMPDGTLMRKKVHLYIGPEGISEIPDKNLGQFSDVVVDLSDNITPVVLYDKKQRRFFAIDLAQRSVTKGPQLPENDSHKPIDIGILNKNSDILDFYWSPPNVNSSKEHTGREYLSGHALIRESNTKYRPDQSVLVLDESGRIDLLDKKTLEFVGAVGRLPTPQSFFSPEGQVKPEDLLAYRILPVAFKTDHQYQGLFVASVSREGTDLALAVFDKEGKLIARKDTWTTDHKRSRHRAPTTGRAIFFDVPGGPILLVAKFLLENLHPPILSVLSYFTADSFEAASGHRALFVLPNSFIALKGRDARGHFIVRSLLALLLIIPSIMLAVWLACRIVKDAAVIGLSRKTRRCWFVGALTFGLPAYITYRLIRPKVALVTCANCGKLRRPDMEKCHQCNSPWHVPELMPPAWRVHDRTEKSPSSSSAETNPVE